MMRYIRGYVAIGLILCVLFTLSLDINAQQVNVLRVGKCALSQGQGYSVEQHTVVDIRKSPFDFMVEYNTDHNKMMIVGAKVKSVGGKYPNLQKLDLKKVNKWRNSAFVPGSGFYYLVKSVVSGKLYLIEVISISGDSYTSAIELRWEELSFGNSDKNISTPQPQTTPEITTPPTIKDDKPVQKAKKIKFCRFCGTEILNEGRFCEYCGGDFHQKAEPGDVKYCRFCGEKVVNPGKYCEFCGKEIGSPSGQNIETAPEDEAGSNLGNWDQELDF